MHEQQTIELAEWYNLHSFIPGFRWPSDFYSLMSCASWEEIVKHLILLLSL